MSGFTFAANFTNDLDGWTKAMQQTLAVTSYNRFLKFTSDYEPVVVENDPTLTEVNHKNQCHGNCRIAEQNGVGKRVSGWYVVNEFVYAQFPVGMMRLIHHSNILLADGTYINPTSDKGASHHIFLRDDKRHFDFEKRIGYNDRMVFGDSFMLGKDHIKAVPRNRVLFSADEEYDRDLYYEKFKVHTSREEVIADMPRGLTPDQERKWLKLKSSARFKD
jgi:hypothetical protein